MFEQSETSSPNRMPRRNMGVATSVGRVLTVLALAVITQRKIMKPIVAVILLLLVLGPVYIGQFLGKKRS